MKLWKVIYNGGWSYTTYIVLADTEEQAKQFITSTPNSPGLTVQELPMKPGIAWEHDETPTTPIED